MTLVSWKSSQTITVENVGRSTFLRFDLTTEVAYNMEKGTELDVNTNKYNFAKNMQNVQLKLLSLGVMVLLVTVKRCITLTNHHSLNRSLRR